MFKRVLKNVNAERSLLTMKQTTEAVVDIAERVVETAEDAMQRCRAATGRLLGETICAIMEQEIVHQLRERRMADAHYVNARNGYKHKTLTSNFGLIQARVPQDRSSDYEPLLIGKYRKDVRDIEGAIFRLYAGGRATRLEAAKALYSTLGNRELPEAIVRAIEPKACEIWNCPVEPELALLCVHTAAYEEKSSNGKVSVFTGVARDGGARVLAVSPGADPHSWRAVLETLKERGLRAAAQIETRGAAGLDALIDEIFPKEIAES